MDYRNFKVALYCPVGSLLKINDFKAFGKKFDEITKHIKISKVYLETYRNWMEIDKDKMLKVKSFFTERGIIASGGIAAASELVSDGFDVLCYTRKEGREKLLEIVKKTAGIFDEIILDDYYFTNCKCPECIKAKGDMTWAQYRTKVKAEFSRTLYAEAKKINPGIKLIIKYPNWYEHYQECGYNLREESDIFDGIYAGTETRNPQYTQQHLPKYHSYFIMRYLENVKPGKNMGGWFDPFECSYSLTSYVEQAYLTLFAKARETAVFSLEALLKSDFSLCAPVLGQLYTDMDNIMGELGNPAGTACYLPYDSRGEDYLHNYLGMAGIPFEPYPCFPAQAKTVFLTESAACDGDIINKMEESLKNGSTVIVTSGFLAKTQDKGFGRLTSARLSGRKACVNKYAYSFGGVFFGGCAQSAEKVIIPQIEFPNNDTWELAAAFGEENNFPILLRTAFGRGNLYILTVPDDYGGFYEYPREILKIIRKAFYRDMKVMLDAKSKIGIFVYDNDTFIVRSFLPYIEPADIIVKNKNARIKDIISGEVYEGVTDGKETTFKIFMPPAVNRFFKIIQGKC